MIRVLIQFLSISLVLSCGENPREGYLDANLRSELPPVQQEFSLDDELLRYMVQLTLYVRVQDGTGVGHCSGTLWGEQYVITAAHCVHDGAITRIKASVGGGYFGVLLPNGRRFSKTVYADKVAFRKLSNESFFKGLFLRHADLNDVGVIKLKNKLNLPYRLRYRWLPRDKKMDLSGKKAIVAGYGKGKPGQLPFIPRYSEVKIKKDDKVKGVLYHVRPYSVNKGDSGGPVWLRGKSGRLYLVGIHSFSLSLLGMPDRGSVDIRNHQYWLRKAMAYMDMRYPPIRDEDDLIIRKMQ